MSVIIYTPKLHGEEIQHQQLQLAGKEWPTESCESRALEYWKVGDAESAAAGVVIADQHPEIEAEYAAMGIRVVSVNSDRAVTERTPVAKQQALKDPAYIDPNLVKTMLKAKIPAVRNLVKTLPIEMLVALEAHEETNKKRKFALIAIRDQMALRGAEKAEEG